MDGRIYQVRDVIKKLWDVWTSTRANNLANINDKISLLESSTDSKLNHLNAALNSRCTANQQQILWLDVPVSSIGGAGVNSIQRGTFSCYEGDTGNINITSVNLDKAAVICTSASGIYGEWYIGTGASPCWFFAGGVTATVWLSSSSVLSWQSSQSMQSWLGSPRRYPTYVQWSVVEFE